jgi:predicted nucleic acid-binding protein
MQIVDRCFSPAIDKPRISPSEHVHSFLRPRGWHHLPRSQRRPSPNTPADLSIGCTAETAGVPLVHYDRDYERIADVSTLEHHWLLPNGTLV